MSGRYWSNVIAVRTARGSRGARWFADVAGLDGRSRRRLVGGGGVCVVKASARRHYGRRRFVGGWAASGRRGRRLAFACRACGACPRRGARRLAFCRGGILNGLNADPAGRNCSFAHDRVNAIAAGSEAPETWRWPPWTQPRSLTCICESTQTLVNLSRTPPRP